MEITYNPRRQIVRRNVLALVAVGLLGIIGVRFFQYQILYHDQYAAYAADNSIRDIPLPAPRGFLFDRHGDFLVTNSPQYQLAVIPAEIYDNLDKLDILWDYLGVPAEEMVKKVQDASGPYSRYQPVILHKEITYVQWAFIEEHRLEFPGVFILDSNIRHYPSRARVSHVLGYLRSLSKEDLAKYRKVGYGPTDVIGASGVEKIFESKLRGDAGFNFRLVDNLLRDLGDVPNKESQLPIPGENIALSIDLDLQIAAERLLEGKIGTIVAVDPANGEVLVYASAPDYPLAPFVRPIPVALWKQYRDSPGKMLLNRPINGLYPPGSTFKVIAAAAALAADHVDPNITFECTGAYQYGNRTYPCNRKTGHGLVDMRMAMRVSCNIYFYQLIGQITFKTWYETSRVFGFGRPTGIELPQEYGGLVPDRPYMNDKYGLTGWSGGHVLNFVLGQGELLVTPLQVVRMTAAIANGGTLVRPTLLYDASDPEEELEFIDLPDWIWNELQLELFDVVNGGGGTGFRARVPGARVYGKTGTAQNSTENPHAWFTGFIRLNTGRQLALTVLVEQGGSGGVGATPLAGEIFSLYKKLYEPREGRDIVQVH